MKMVVLLVKENQSALLSEALMRSDFRVTKISSTGGFLRKRVETLLVGVNKEQVPIVLEKVRDVAEKSGEDLTYFLMDVARFERV